MTLIRLPPDHTPISQAQPSSPSYPETTAEMHRHRPSEHQAPAKKPLSPGATRALPLARKMIYAIHRLEGSYFAREDQLHYNISISPLSFDGIVPRGEEQYIRPLQRSAVIDMLETTKIWEEKNMTSDLKPLSCNALIPNGNYTDASFVWQCIRDYLCECGAKDYYKTVIDDCVPWMLFSNAHKGLHRRCEPGRNWQAEAYIRYCLPGTEDFDPEKPHINCFIGDHVPLQADRLSLSEVQSILWLSTVSASQQIYLSHNIIPVTIVSCSGRRLRIVQGIVDFKKQSVQIRKTDILDFSTGIRNKENWDNFLIVLSWLIGEPVGNTK